jgi:hypothetical protein
MRETGDDEIGAYSRGLFDEGASDVVVRGSGFRKIEQVDGRCGQTVVCCESLLEKERP